MPDREPEQIIRSAYEASLVAATRYGLHPVFSLEKTEDRTGYNFTEHSPVIPKTRLLRTADLGGDCLSDGIDLNIFGELTFWDENPAPVIVEQGSFLIGDHQQAGISWGIRYGDIVPNALVLRLALFPREVIGYQTKKILTLAKTFIETPTRIQPGLGIEVVAYQRKELMEIRSAHFAEVFGRGDPLQIFTDTLDDRLLVRVLEKPFLQTEQQKAQESAAQVLD